MKDEREFFYGQFHWFSFLCCCYSCLDYSCRGVHSKRSLGSACDWCINLPDRRNPRLHDMAWYPVGLALICQKPSFLEG